MGADLYTKVFGHTQTNILKRLIYHFLYLHISLSNQKNTIHSRFTASFQFRLFLPYVFRRTKSATIKNPLPSSSCVFFLRRLKYTAVAVLPPLQRRLPPPLFFHRRPTAAAVPPPFSSSLLQTSTNLFNLLWDFDFSCLVFRCCLLIRDFDFLNSILLAIEQLLNIHFRIWFLDISIFKDLDFQILFII